MRVAIVNDMTMALETLRRLVLDIPHCDVAWVARNGVEAIEKCARDKPDLILMDLVMPGTDGVEATRSIMARSPCPILVVTATVEGHAAKVLEALGAGALDAVQTPVFTVQGQPPGADRVRFKIEAVRRLLSDGDGAAGKNAKRANRPTIVPTDPLVVLGASAGGPAAIAMILHDLPADFAGSIVIIQHIDSQFAPSMATWLDEQTALTVRIARSLDRPQAGTVLIAATNDHLIFSDPHNLAYTPEPRQSHYRPSIDVFFDSVANQWKGDVMGVLLTGMGRDGARGLKVLRDSGALTVAQGAESCVVYGMPKAAVELNAAAEVLSLNLIGPCMTTFVKSRKHGIRL